MIKKAILILLLASPVFSQQIIGRKPLLGEQINGSHPLTKGLIANWLFNEGSGGTVYDLSLNDYDGTLTNMVPLDDWVSGRNGYSLDFDGTGDHIDAGDIDDFSFVDGNSDIAFSLSLWIFMFSVGDGVIMSKYDHGLGNHREWQLRIFDGDDFIMNLYHSDNAAIFIGREYNINFVANTWYYITMTYDGSEVEAGIKLYVNGTEASSYISQSAGAYTGMSNTDATMKIGQSSADVNFAGLIDDVRVYTRELILDEIWSLYAEQYAMFEHPLYGRMLAVAAAAAAGQVIIIMR